MERTFPVNRPETSRRRVLRGIGASLAAGSVGTAGCMSALPPLGQRVRYGRVDVPPSTEPVYRDWIPTPSALRAATDGAVDPLGSSTFTTPGNLGESEVGTPVSIGASVIRSRIDYFGMGLDAYDWALIPGEGVVLAGDVDRSAVDRTLTETVYERRGSYRDFDLYERDDRGRVVAVSGTHVVTDDGPSAGETVRTLVDTGRGRGERYADEDATAARMIEITGSRPFVAFGGLGRPFVGLETDPSRSVTSIGFDESAVYSVERGLFPDAEVPSRTALKDALEERPLALDSVAVDVEIDDRLATVEFRREESDIDSVSDPLVAPQVTWTTEYDADENILHVTHVAGDTIDAETLDLRQTGSSEEDDVRTDSAEVGPGDTISVDVSGFETGDDVTLMQQHPETQSTVTIFTHTLAGASNETETRSDD